MAMGRPGRPGGNGITLSADQTLINAIRGVLRLRPLYKSGRGRLTDEIRFYNIASEKAFATPKRTSKYL